MQAGAAPRGRDFAARWAELICFGGHGQADAAAFRQDRHARMARAGRAAEDGAVLPAIITVVGETPAIARGKAAYRDRLVDPDLVIAWASTMLGADVGDLPTEAEAVAAAGACDGCIVSPTHMPGMSGEFGRQVVPERQRRGQFRREYAGRTLRENLRNPGCGAGRAVAPAG